uniref:Uncharacterized protein n=1 Tax=Cannabis sativa TaxID=3483 RepID=A0A803QF95_CANSA
MHADYSHLVTNLFGIFTPDIGSASRLFFPVATYPPTLTPSPLKPAYTAADLATTTPTVLTSSIVTAISNKENVPPMPVTKRHNDTLTMRQFLKRCRSQNNYVPTQLSMGESSSQNVSYDDMDSDGFIDDSAEIALQSRDTL